ncbi:MAG: IS1634 family transposase [Candidatus Woesearchaeota archaeon]
MNKPFGSLIDNGNEITYNMGLDPLVGAMCEVLGIPQKIDNKTPPRDKRAILKHGIIIKAMIINILDERSHLVNFAESFEDKDCQTLFGEGVTADLFTQDRLGDTLDAVSELNHRKLGSEISSNALQLHGIPVNSSHIDTTNLTVFGEYNNSENTEDADNNNDDNEFNIDYGKPKNKRKECKQVNFGSAVQQDLLPLFGEALSGNKSDVKYFREAMDEFAQNYTGGLSDKPILVLDAAGSYNKTFNQAHEQQLPCIIRFSKRYNLAEESIRQAFEDDSWQKVGVVAKTNKDQASNYKITSYDRELGNHSWRLIVVHSSQLEEKKEATAARKLPKTKENLVKKANKLAKTDYETEEKAREKAEAFVNKRTKLEEIFDYEIKIESETTEKQERPGPPTPDTKIIKTTTYHAIITIGDVNEDLYQKWLEYNSCFIIASNVPQQRCSDEEVLKEYKKQWKIESQYKFIKQPKMIEPIWLQKDERVKALFFILFLAIMVAAFLRHRLCASLELIEKTNNESENDNSDNKNTGQKEDKSKATNEKKQKEQPQIPDIKDLKEIYKNKIEEAVSGKIQTRTGRLVENPTFNVIENNFDGLQTIGKWKNGNFVKKFINNIERRLLKLMVYMGFHPSIYIEPYHPGHDLWSYG